MSAGVKWLRVLDIFRRYKTLRTCHCHSLDIKIYLLVLGLKNLPIFPSFHICFICLYPQRKKKIWGQGNSRGEALDWVPNTTWSPEHCWQKKKWFIVCWNQGEVRSTCPCTQGPKFDPWRSLDSGALLSVPGQMQCYWNQTALHHWAWAWNFPAQFYTHMHRVQDALGSWVKWGTQLLAWPVLIGVGM